MYLKSMYPDVPPIPEQNIHNLCFRRPDQADWPDYTLHIDSVTGRKRTYSEFKERVYDGATALGSSPSDGGLGLGAEDGEIVGILSENCMDYIALAHSLLALTVPFALLSSYSTPFELSHGLRLSKATRLFVHPKSLPLALRAAKEAGIPDNYIYILNGRVAGRKDFHGLIDSTRKRRVPRLGVRPAKGDTLAYLVFSSGTSGLPKAVMISHGNLAFSMYQGLMSAQEITKVYTPPVLDTPEGIPVSLAFLPLHHTYGLHGNCFRGFYGRTTFVIMPRWNVDIALRLIPKYKITSLSLIPSVVHQLINSPNLKKTDLSSLRFISSGAAYLPPQLASKLSEHTRQAYFSEGYGQSEGTIAAVIKPFPGILGGLQPIAGCAGILLPGMEARILREDGSETNVNEAGELWLKSGSIALGYWNNEKASKETFIDGWLRTGDRFRADEKGNFYFEDRTKDTLKVSGAQVSPVEIENVILAHPDKLITDATVAGVSGGRTSDERVPRAWIVLSKEGKKRGNAEVIKALEAWSQENLSKYKWLRGGIEVVKEIPKSPTGKTLRRVLQDQYEKRQAKTPKPKL